MANTSQPRVSATCRDVVSGLHALELSLKAWSSVTGRLVDGGVPDNFATEVQNVAGDLQAILRGLITRVAPAAASSAPGQAGAESTPVAAAGTKSSPKPAPSAVAVSALDPEIPEYDDDGAPCVLSATGPGFAVAGLIQFLSQSAKSGTLQLATKQDQFTLCLESGVLMHAESKRRPADERLGELLMQRGAVQRDKIPRLRAICAAGDREGMPLGQALQRDGLVEGEALRDVLREQNRRLFARMLFDEGAWFAFYEGNPRYPALYVELDLMRLLLDSVRRYGSTLTSSDAPSPA